MYEAHSVFKQPENIDVKVWRYMDFTKFVDLIDSHSLFFATTDTFDKDSFEGSWPKLNVASRCNQAISCLPTAAFLQEDPDKIFIQLTQDYMEKSGDYFKGWKKCCAVNCWHMNECESAAMWNLYLKSQEGIAIQSTYRKLRDSITDDEKVFLGVVKYIDYENDVIDGGNLLAPYVHKRKSFEHEREIRALLLANPPAGENGLAFDKAIMPPGVKIEVNIQELIEKIYIAPSSPDWFSRLVGSVAQRYSYTFDVVHSKLDDKPIF